MGVALYLNRRLRYYFFGPSSALTLWPFVSQWQSASDEDWALALAREAVIRLLTDQPEVTEELVVTAGAEVGICRSLVYRLVTRQRLSDNEKQDSLDLAVALLDRALPSPEGMNNGSGSA